MSLLSTSHHGNAVLREIICDLELLYQTSSDPHTASLLTSMQCIENVGKHMVNFFATVTSSSGSSTLTADGSMGAAASLQLSASSSHSFAHAVDAMLFQLLSAPNISLIDFVRKMLASSDALVASASAQEYKCLKEAFATLCVIVELCGPRLTARQCSIMRKASYDTFVRLSRSNTHHAVQAEAVKLLTTLVEAAACDTVGTDQRLTAIEVDLPRVLEAVERCVSKPSAGQGVRGWALRLLGVAMDRYPADALSLIPFVTKVFVQCMEAMTSRAEPDQLVGEGLLVGVDALLRNFGSHQDVERSLLPLLFPFVKCALLLPCGGGGEGDGNNAATTMRYQFPKAALRIIKHHAMLLRVPLYADATHMYDLLRTLCGHKNVELHKSAYPAAQAFLEAVAFTSCHTDVATHGATPSASPQRAGRGTSSPSSTSSSQWGGASPLVKLLSMTKETLLQHTAPYQLSFAIVAYGALARPMARVVAASDMLQLFHELAAKCQGFLDGTESNMESATRHLPQFLSTYASILSEIPSAALVNAKKGAQSVAVAVAQLIDAVLVLFPRHYFFPKQRAATPLALMKLFLVCSKHPAVLGKQVAQFVERGIAVSIGSSRMFRDGIPTSVTGGRVAANADETNVDSDDHDVPHKDRAAQGTSIDEEEGSLYEEYLPLWRGLLTLHEMPSHKWTYPWNVVVQDGDVLLHCIAIRHHMLRCVVQSVRSMDLQCTTTSSGVFSGVGPLSQQQQQPRVTTETTMGYGTVAIIATDVDHCALNVNADGGMIAPRSPKDYALFLCLVLLFERLSPHLLLSVSGSADSSASKEEERDAALDEWILVLVQAVTERSTVWGHVSGYYTILEAILAHTRRRILASPTPRNNNAGGGAPSLASVLTYFYDTAVRRIPNYSRELLLACSSCLLAFPCPELVSPEQLSIPLVTLFRLGLEHEPAAMRALNVLDALLSERGGGGGGGGTSTVQRALLPQILPFLHAYLIPDDKDANGAKGGASPQATTRATLAKRATALVGHAGLRLAAVMRDAATLGDGTASDILRSSHPPHHSHRSHTALANVVLDQDRSLRLTLPMRDTVIDVPMGVLLPRVLELVKSPNRQIRMASSEFLHALVLWVVGSINVRPLDASGDPTGVLHVLFPTVLELAAANDPVIAELFSRLAFQLSHWYAQCPVQDVQSASRGPTQFLDAAMDALRGSAMGAEAAVRSVASRCITELLRWAAKHPRTRGVDHTRMTLRRLAGLFHHPSSHQRLGAAMCFNSLYTVFREMEMAVISEHALDLLYHTFAALLLETDESESGASAQLRAAILHMERIVVFHSATLIAPDARRTGQLTTLSDAVSWMFHQCGSTQKLCRSLAMRLFTTLASCLPGFETEDGPSRWLIMTGQSTDVFAGVYEAFSIPDAHLRVAQGGAIVALPALMEWTKEIEASISCHLWLLAARYMSPFAAFGKRAEQPNKKLRTEAAILGGSPQSHHSSNISPATATGKSLLPAQLWALCTLLARRKVHCAAAVLVDSQAVWLPDADEKSTPQEDATHHNTAAPTGVALALASRIVSVLEAAASLYEVITERYPSCLWTESELDATATSNTTMRPLLHRALYVVAVELAVAPHRIVGSGVFAAGEQQRIQHVAWRLIQVCWKACSGGGTFAQREQQTFESCLGEALPKALLADIPTLHDAILADPSSHIRAVVGARTLHRIGCVANDFVMGRQALLVAGSRTTTQEAITSRLESTMEFLQGQRHLLISSPLLQAFYTEWVGLLLDMAPMLDAVVSLVIEEGCALARGGGMAGTERETSTYSAAPSQLHPGGDGGRSSTSLQRMSTGALALRQVQSHVSLWYGPLRGELEHYLDVHASDVLRGCLNLLRNTTATTPINHEGEAVTPTGTPPPTAPGELHAARPHLIALLQGLLRRCCLAASVVPSSTTNHHLSAPVADLPLMLWRQLAATQEGPSGPLPLSEQPLDVLSLRIEGAMLLLQRALQPLSPVSKGSKATTLSQPQPQVATLPTDFYAPLLRDLEQVLLPWSWICKRHELLQHRDTAVHWLLEGTRVCTRLSTMFTQGRLEQHDDEELSAIIERWVHLVKCCVGHLLLHELPIAWNELPARSVEWDTYCLVVQQCVCELVEAVARHDPARLFDLLPLMQDRSHPLRSAVIHCVDHSIARLPPLRLPLMVQLCFTRQQQALPIVVRQGITHHMALPCLRRLPHDALTRLFATHVAELYKQVESVGFGSTETVDAANTLCVTRTCAFVLLTTLYRTCSAEAVRGEVNRAFVSKIVSPSAANQSTGKELTEKLLRACMQVRTFSPVESPVDAGLWMQYRQAAFTCLVAVVATTQRQEKLFVQFLLREKNKDLWWQIVDCGAVHQFTIETNFDEVSERITSIRTDWEMQSTAAGATITQSLSSSLTTGGGGGVAGSQHNHVATVVGAHSGANRVRYLSSQYLHDSHLTFGFHADPNGNNSPPPLLAGSLADAGGGAGTKVGEARLLDEAIEIASMPKHHRETIIASMQVELQQGGGRGLSQPPEDGDVNREQAVWNDAAVGGAHQPYDALANSTTSIGDNMDAVTGRLQGSPGSRGEQRSIELDTVWLSTCSNTLLYLLDTLIKLFPSATYSGAPVEGGAVALSQTGGAGAKLTSWVDEWITILSSSETHINTKLVFARLISLRAGFFDRFAAELFEPLARLAMDPSLGKGLHYVCRDILLLFLQWKTPLPPFHPSSESTANRLVSHLVRNISHKTRHVLRNNLEVFKLLMEKWRGRCHVDKKDILGWLCYEENNDNAQIARMCGVQLCGILAANNIPLFDARFDSTPSMSEEILMKRLVQNVSFHSSDVASACAEVVGMTLKRLQAASTTVDDRTVVLKSVVSQKLWAMIATARPERFLKVLRNISEHHPDILDEFVPAKLMTLYHALPSPQDQAVVFELFGMRCERADVLFPALHAHISTMNALRPLLKTALYQLVLLLVPRLSPGLLVHCIKGFLTEQAVLTTLRDVVDARVAFYKSCVCVLEQRRADVKTACDNDPYLLNLMERFIVLGLEDSSVFIRDLLVRYWDHDDRLSLDGSTRFSQLFSKVLFAATSAPIKEEKSRSNDVVEEEVATADHKSGSLSRMSRSVSNVESLDAMMERGLGSGWLQHASILMLSLCHRSPDFHRTDALFPQPLKHCRFHPVALDARASLASSSSVTSLAPMFASQIPVARLTRTPVSLGGYLNRRIDVDEQGAASQMIVSSANMLLATMPENRLFPPTQEGLFTVFERTIAPSSSQSSLLFTSSMRYAGGGGGATQGSAGSSLAGSVLRHAKLSAVNASMGGGSETTMTAIPLRRRFRRTAEDDAVRTHIVHASRLRQERDAQMERTRAQRAQGVTLYRSYRDGEVPDVQIALQSLVIPWQALLLHDQELAKTTLTHVGRSLLGRIRDIAASSSAPSAAGGVGVGTHNPHTSVLPTSAATFLIDIPGALSVQVARQTQDDLRKLFLDVFHPSRLWRVPHLAIEVCHELLLFNAATTHAADPHGITSNNHAATHLPNPSQVIASSMSRTSTSLRSALLLLECHLTPFDGALSQSRRRAVAGRVLSASSPNNNNVLSCLHRAFTMHHEQSKATAVAHRIVQNSGIAQHIIDAYMAASSCRAGDWEQPVKSCRQLLSSLGEDEGTTGAHQEDVVSMAQEDMQRAMVAMLRWDDITTTIDVRTLNRSSMNDLLTLNMHQVQRYVTGWSLQTLREHGVGGGGGETTAAPRCITQLPIGYYSLQRALSLVPNVLDAQQQHSVQSLLHAGIDTSLRASSTSGEESLVTLHALTTLSSMVDALLLVHAKPSEAVFVLHRILKDYVSSVPSRLSASAEEWDLVLAVSESVAELTLRVVPAAFRIEIPRSVVDDVTHAQQQLHIRAAAALSTTAHGVLAAKAILARPSAKLKVALQSLGGTGKPDDAAMSAWKYRIWLSVVRATMARVYHLPPISTTTVGGSGDAVRRSWGDLLTVIRNKRNSDAAVIPEVHASLESEFWGKFATSLMQEEGVQSTNMEELAAMCGKAHEKSNAFVDWLGRKDTDTAAPRDLAATPLSTPDPTRQQQDMGRGTTDIADIQRRQHAHLSTMLLLQEQFLQRSSHMVEDGDLKHAALRATVSLQFAGTLLQLICTFECRDASTRFPKLLELLNEEVPTIAATGGATTRPLAALVADKSAVIPTSCVVPCCAQLLSSLGRPKVGAVMSHLIRRIAVHHPQALYYPFVCTREDLEVAVARLPDSPEARVVVDTVRFLAHAFALEPTLASLRTFTTELHYLHNPELRVRPWLNELRRVVPSSSSGSNKAQSLFTAMLQDVFDTDANRGVVNARFASEHGKFIRKTLCGSELSNVLDPLLMSGDLRVWKDTIDKVAKEMRAIVDTTGLQPLAVFSRTLARLELGHYGADSIELPRQPSEFYHSSRTHHQAPPRVVGIDANVLVLSSQQRPKRIKLYTSDEQVHLMLIKGGEDLRLDQRIQELFTAVNSIVTSQQQASPSTMRERYPLSIRTYSVVPVSKRVGIIGWVPNTVVLKEMIERQMQRDAYGATDIAHHPATREYRSLFEVPGGVPMIDQYVLMYRDFPNRGGPSTGGTYTQRIEAIVQTIHPFYLRNAMQGMAATAADYYDLRGRWSASLATLSIASYVLGIGDRHLENILVDRASGAMVAIDFGHAFGSATTSLPIPELIPFRLSPQLTASLGPMGTSAVVGAMETVMGALHEHRTLLYTLASSFLSEPLLDWEIASKMQQGGDSGDAAVGSDVAKAKLDAFYRKLKLENPVSILATEIGKNNKVRHLGVVDDVIRAARGDPIPFVSAPTEPTTTTTIRGGDSSRLELKSFVRTLVDQATDLNILGRTWAGWSPLF